MKQSDNYMMIPSSFNLYKDKEQRKLYPTTDTDFLEVIRDEPFYFDIFYALEWKRTMRPWENPKEYLPIILEERQEQTTIIEDFYKKRGKENITDRMLYYLSLFLLTLFYLNYKPVKSVIPQSMNLHELKRKPMNCEERLEYIMRKPSQYHAYIQLDQLFIELEKIYYKAIAMKEL
ncbi:YpoC family protein [Metabacillus sp. HB246100]|uniref:YpoC family protein n=1 Tax=Bacillus weihaiensis TaxID=1547283 RepID=UPI00235217F3|nr:hypothetical protein [Bacillus weihaiensis]